MEKDAFEKTGCHRTKRLQKDKAQKEVIWRSK